jgi:hypothetical protein
VRSFDFVLPGGTVLFTEDRYELAAHIQANKKRPRKTCRFRHSVNGTVYSGTGPRRITYNWPAVIAAGPGATVFVVEGANKANPLIAAGLPATAAPYHQWENECVEALAGRHILYLEDHDHPNAQGQCTARKLSADAHAKLSSLAASFRVAPGWWTSAASRHRRGGGSGDDLRENPATCQNGAQDPGREGPDRGRQVVPTVDDFLGQEF